MTADLDATLAAIDALAVQQCGQCCTALSPDGQSPDFCGPDCQQTWTETRNEIVELIGYREPDDLPVHQSRLVELWSPEVVPTHPDSLIGGDLFGDLMSVLVRRMEEATVWVASFEVALANQIVMVDQRGILTALDVSTPEPDPFPWSFHAEIRQRISVAFDVPRHLLGDWGPFSLVVPPEPPQPEPVCEVPFDPDYEYDWRPVPYLADEQPALPVMADLERDWQALVDVGLQRSFAARPPDVHQRRVVEQQW